MEFLPKNSQFIHSSFYLFINSLLISITGLIFWIFSSWFFPVDYVGEASALLGLMNFTIVVANFGFYLSIIRFIQKSSNPGELITTIFIINILIISILSFTFYFIFVIFSKANVYFSLIDGLGFCLLSVFNSLFMLSESILIGFQKFFRLLTRTLLYNILRIIFLIISIEILSFNMIFLAWALASTITFLISLFLLSPKIPGILPPNIIKGISEIQKIIQYSLANYVSSLFWFGSGHLLPVFISILLTTRETAYFSIPWTLINFAYLIPLTINKSMVLQYASKSDSDFKDLLLNAIKLNLLTVIPVLFLFIMLGSQVLSVYGSDYAIFGFNTLFFLSLSTLPISIIQISIGIFQIQQKNKNFALIRVGSVTISFLLIFLLISSFSLTAFSLGWFLGHLITSMPCFYLIIKALRT